MIKDFSSVCSCHIGPCGCKSNAVHGQGAAAYDKANEIPE